MYEFVNHHGIELFGLKSLPSGELTDDLICSEDAFETIRKQDQDILQKGANVISILYYADKDRLYWGEKSLTI